MLRIPSESERERLGEILSHGFGFPREDAKGWFARAGHENLRVFETNGGIAGGLFKIPMGQYFGGRAVSTWGVAGVGLVPELRGKGHAVQMMLSLLREARESGVALSSLLPATMTLYRKVGYERGSAHYTMSFDPNAVVFPRVRDVEVAEVAGVPDDLKALYAKVVSDGSMNRGEYIWSRIREPRGLRPTKTFAFRRGGALEGYVVVSHSRLEGLDTNVTVTDLAATSAPAALAIFDLLKSYGSIAKSVKWNGDPADIFSVLFPERAALTTHLEEFVMVRVVDVTRAFTERGWPPNARGTLAFDVRDGSMPENSGRYVVSLADGRAAVERSGSASTVALTEHALAAIYTGTSSARTLVQTGLLEASPADCALLDAWFAGRAPVTRDFF